MLANYAELVGEVEVKKEAAETEVNRLKDISVEFKCDGTDPKGVAAQFKENRVAQQTALKEYKTAVKNLIVGVKSVQSTESKPAETASPDGDQE